MANDEGPAGTLKLTVTLDVRIHGHRAPLTIDVEGPRPLARLRETIGAMESYPDVEIVDSFEQPLTDDAGKKYCPKHLVLMSEHAARGETWYSHNVNKAAKSDNEKVWCKGRPGPDSRGWNEAMRYGEGSSHVE